MQTYRQLGTVVHAAMSADSSCRGLRSPRDGPIVLELTKGLSAAALTSLPSLTVCVRVSARQYSSSSPLMHHFNISLCLFQTQFLNVSRGWKRMERDEEMGGEDA